MLSRRFVTLVSCLLATLFLIISVYYTEELPFPRFAQSFFDSVHTKAPIWHLHPLLAPEPDFEPVENSHLIISTSTLSSVGNVGLPSSPIATPLRIAITETCGCHDEVVAALVHAFGPQSSVQLSLYQREQRYVIAEVLNGFQLKYPLPPCQPPETFIDNAETRIPDIVVATTCEFEMMSLRSRFQTLFEEGKTYLFCVMHHADRWIFPFLAEAAIQWLDRSLLTFITLSPHTATYLRDSVVSGRAINGTAPIVTLPPVFPVPLPPLASINMRGELAFAIQGNFETERRDYAHIFASLSSFQGPPTKFPKTSRNVSVHLLGHGDHPPVPAKVSSHAMFDEDLTYPEFYTIVARPFALLPAFATDEYYQTKASSFVPAALIGGTPLVAIRKLLEEYAYLPAEAVYLQVGSG